MVFHSSLRKELARSFGATLVVLITIVMSMMLIRTLGLASRGSVSPQDVMMVMGYTVLGHLPTILTMSLFISIMAVMGRMYRDSEMVIWFSSGRGLAGFLAPILRFAWPILLVNALLAMVVWPWSNQQASELKDRYERRNDLERVTPGQFQENASGSRVFFIEKKATSDAAGLGGATTTPLPVAKGGSAAQSALDVVATTLGSGSNVFISATEHGKQSITSSRTGRINTIQDERFLLLSQGQRLEQQQTSNEIKISEFAEYGVRVNGAGLQASDAVPVKAQPSLTLLRTPSAIGMAELCWRIGLALAAFNLSLLALSLCGFNPRAGRGGNLLSALFVFIIYYNFLNVGYGWVSHGKLSWVTLLLGLHGGVTMLGLMWLAARHYQWSWRQLISRKKISRSHA